MTRNSPITHQDFTSIVEKAIEQGLTYVDRKNANENFKFTDIEVGKIYVFYNDIEVWFMTPVWIESEDNYGIMWCYYVNGLKMGDSHEGGGRIIMAKGGFWWEHCESWQTHIWANQMWHVLDTPPHFKYINWAEDPFEVKS